MLWRVEYTPGLLIAGDLATSVLNESCPLGPGYRSNMGDACGYYGTI